MSSATRGQLAQENTTATQTESSLFSNTPHHHISHGQSPNLSQQAGVHDAHIFNSAGAVAAVLPNCHITGHISDQSPSPHPPHSAVLQASASGNGKWPVPFTVPLPSPNEISDEALLESSVNYVSSSATSQPESWGASNSIEEVTEDAAVALPQESKSVKIRSGQTSGGAVMDWIEPEHDEEMMDDLVEPILPVHDLAEADQSQGMLL